MYEDNEYEKILNSKFCTKSGESKIEKDDTKKSLTHEEAKIEIDNKAKALLEMLNSNEQNDEKVEILSF